MEKPPPDFIIVGAQKCGTSTLFRMLATHPRLIPSRAKEPHFFSVTPDWRANLEEYLGLWSDDGDGLRFEASTSYTFYPHRNLEIWEDMYAMNPDLRIVYIVREPVARVVSAYMHHYERGYSDLSFSQAIWAQPRFINVTRYTTQITPFINRFGRDRVHICYFEDLVRAPRDVVSSLAEFLGVDPEEFGDIEGIHSNKSIGGGKRSHKYDDPSLALRAIRRYVPSLWDRITDNTARAFDKKPQPTEAEDRAIRYLLRQEIDGLEALTGRDLSAWRGHNPLAESLILT